MPEKRLVQTKVNIQLFDWITARASEEGISMVAFVRRLLMKSYRNSKEARETKMTQWLAEIDEND